ncbi:hypothetical protein ACSLNH_17020, partial [Comamonas kerstersii]|uniref:hypothetical protein n=1 Tax=Comamonas kerstersii TaxID=225992 RepID=UPI003EE26CA0
VESAQGLQYVVVQVGEYAAHRYAIGRQILWQNLWQQSALLLLARQPDAGNQAIESLHHGLHFPWGLLLGQRGDVIGLALL